LTIFEITHYEFLFEPTLWVRWLGRTPPSRLGGGGGGSILHALNLRDENNVLHGLTQLSHLEMYRRG